MANVLNDHTNRRLVLRVLRENFPEQRGRYAVAIAAMIVVAATTALSAWLIGDVIDGMVTDRDRDALLWLAAVVAVLFIVKGIATFIQTERLARVGNAIVARQQARIYDRILASDLATLGAHGSGDLLVRVTHNAAAVRNVINLIVTSAVKDAFTEQSAEVSQRVTVVPNGIAPFTSPTKSNSLRAELGIDASVPLIATVGQIGLRKGHDLARDALLTLATDSTDPLDFRWLVVGERFSQKPESVAYEAALSDRLGDRVIRLGYRHDVPAILRQIDLLLHPARQEPFGRVLLEAAEAGCPVVGFDVGGNRFSLPNSWLVPLENVSPAEAVAGLAAAIRASLTDPIRESAGRFPIERCREQTWAIWTAAHKPSGV